MNCEQAITQGKMTINPYLAGYIVHNLQFERQRTLNAGHVSALAEIMMQGDWQSGHSIHFAKHNGKLTLVDGQHRLHAVIQSGKKQDFFVVVHPCQAEQDVSMLFCTFDTNNRKRSAADLIQAYGMVQGEKISKSLSARLYEAALLIENNFQRIGHLAPKDKNVKFRLQLVEKWHEEALLYQEAIRGADRHLKNKLSASGCLAVGLATFRYQREIADKFWVRVADGASVTQGDPRKALAYDLRNRYLTTGSISMAESSCSIAWNAFFGGRRRQQIKIPQNYHFTLLGTPWGKR